MNGIYIIITFSIIILIVILFVLLTSIESEREARKRRIVNILRRKFHVYNLDSWLDEVAEEIINEDA